MGRNTRQHSLTAKLEGRSSTVSEAKTMWVTVGDKVAQAKPTSANRTTQFLGWNLPEKEPQKQPQCLPTWHQSRDPRPALSLLPYKESNPARPQAANAQTSAFFLPPGCVKARGLAQLLGTAFCLRDWWLPIQEALNKPYKVSKFSVETFNNWNRKQSKNGWRTYTFTVQMIMQPLSYRILPYHAHLRPKFVREK